jgi:hypothetical protein
VRPGQARSWVRLRRTEFGLRVALVAAWCVALGLELAPPEAHAGPGEPGGHVGPFAGPEGSEKTAVDAGVVFAALRERAAALAPPDAPVVARLSPVAGALAGYALLVVAAVVW